jgi:hypothetical protein
VAYIMSLVAGFGVGEALFGSYGASGAGML